MSDSNNNGSNVGGMVAAFAFGALVGAGAALLLAPRSGRETRELIAKKGRELGDAVREQVAKGSHMLRDVGDRFASSVEAGRKAAAQVESENHR